MLFRKGDVVRIKLEALKYLNFEKGCIENSKGEENVFCSESSLRGYREFLQPLLGKVFTIKEEKDIISHIEHTFRWRRYSITDLETNQKDYRYFLFSSLLEKVNEKTF